MWSGVAWYIGYQVMVQAYWDAYFQAVTFDFTPR